MMKREPQLAMFTICPPPCGPTCELFPALVMIGFSIAAMGVMAFYPPFWALPTRMLSDRSAAASFGFMNLIANLGGCINVWYTTQ